jgi:hypothetical protein
LTASKPESQAADRVTAEHEDATLATHTGMSRGAMTGDMSQKPPTNSGKKPSATQVTRKDRLAEELRANLKRRKAAARRHKEADKGGGGASSEDDQA